MASASSYGAIIVTPEPIQRGTPTPSPAPTDTPKTTETPKPTEPPKPTETPKPTESPKPTETLKPTETPKPTETLKPTETPKPTELPEPTDTAIATPVVWESPSPSPSAASTPLPAMFVAQPYTNGDTSAYLALGSEGIQVEILQARLQALGYLSGEPDGLFTDATETAVYAFEKQQAMYADGIASPEMLKLLYSAAAQPSVASPTTPVQGIPDDAAITFYKTKTTASLYFDPALSQKTSAKVPAKTILLSKQAFGEGALTVYNGAVGYVALDAVEELDPEREIVRFSDVSVGYYIRNALGLLKGIDSIITVTATSARDRYASEYDDVEVHLSDLAAVTSLDINGEAKKSAGGAYTLPRDPANYDDLRLCSNLKTLKIYTLNTATIDVHQLFDCRAMECLTLENVKLKNMDQFWKMSTLRSLRILKLHIMKRYLLDSRRVPRPLKFLRVCGCVTGPAGK